jgi:hypothetical protein
VSLHLFIISNKDNFITNLEQYSIYTRCHKDLYLSQAKGAIYQKGFHYFAVKIFNNIPSDNKIASGNTKRFKKPPETFFVHSHLLQFGGILETDNTYGT